MVSGDVEGVEVGEWREEVWVCVTRNGKYEYLKLISVLLFNEICTLAV